MTVEKANPGLTVVDFFCWGGWFSEGFRQQGFDVIMGIDYWKPAVDTHNLNHGLSDNIKSVLDYWSDDWFDVSEINGIPDSDCIIGSPPCVSFSSSNKSWKADKSLWIRLIEAYLRVIAVKKHKPGSILKAWFMENVPNSQKYVYPEYSFEMLSLWEWAKGIWKRPQDIALKVRDNGAILDSGDYGAPQSRKRYVAWELCSSWNFISPRRTHEKHVTLGDVLGRLPSPNLSKDEVLSSHFQDPNYPELKLKWFEVTDHFYDTWIYTIEWESARYLKQNHSYMGKMSFPENVNRPCRTIMATKSAKTREALIFESEFKRKWNGQYRVPTIREIWCLMGFPMSYQFTWSEWTKWRQIWNAVSPHLSSALAKAVLESEWISLLDSTPELKINWNSPLNLNTFSEKEFNSPKTRKANARFRRHAVKMGNMIVELMNYSDVYETPGKVWQLRAFFWTWEWYREFEINKKTFLEVKEFLIWGHDAFKNFSIQVEDRFQGINSWKFQSIYENDLNIVDSSNPILILDWIREIIERSHDKAICISNCLSIPKKNVHLGQLYAIYAIWRLIY